MSKLPKVRPFFKYFGAKWRDCDRLYAPPRYETVIEPFAGSAGYSVKNNVKKAILYDLSPVICGVWDFLIKAKPEDIMRLPLEFDHVDDLSISQEEKWFLGFWINASPASPCKSPSVWARNFPEHGSWREKARIDVAKQVGRIKDWRIVNASYSEIDFTGQATWFIDPPYEKMGSHYKFGSSQIDFDHLGVWCKSRNGQVFVCENEGAEWLPFKPVGKLKSTRGKRVSSEVVWTNDPNPQQCLLFD